MTDQTTASPVTVTGAAPAHDPATYRVVPASSSPLDATVWPRSWPPSGSGSRRRPPARSAPRPRPGSSLPLGVPVVLPALGPLPRRDHQGARRVAHRRRRPRGARPVHGLRRDARRPPQPRRRRRRRQGARDGHAVRDAVPLGHRGGRAVSATLRPRPAALRELRHRGHDVRAAHGARVHRTQGDHQDRGRLPRRVRRAAGLGQARRRRGRPRGRARSRHAVRGRGGHRPRRPLQRPPRLEQLFAEHGNEIACVFMEPVLENIGIVIAGRGLPRGRARHVRRQRRAAGPRRGEDRSRPGTPAPRSGSASRPTSCRLAKSIGGGLPLAAFGGRGEVMACVTDGRMPHFGTYNGNPLVMAAAVAIDEIATVEALEPPRRSTSVRSTSMSGIIGDARAAGPHRRLRRQGRGHVVGHTGAQLPRLQAHRLRCGRALVAVGSQPGILTPARARRAVARVVRAHPCRHGRCWSADFRELAVALRA